MLNIPNYGKINRLGSYIVCPSCRSRLDFIEYNSYPLQGLFRCPGGHYYPVFNGVPVLIKNDILEEFLGIDEIKEFRIACRKLSIQFNSAQALTQKELLLKRNYINWSLQWDLYTLKGTSLEERKTFMEHVPIDENELYRYKKILEVGCGNGRGIQQVKRNDSLIFGIDISNSAYFTNKRHERDNNVFVLRCDAHCLPFDDAFFDFVFSDHVLQHMSNLPLCFNEIRRVLRRDNEFIFNLYSKENNFIMTKIIEPFKKVFLKRMPVSFVHTFAHLPAIPLWLSIKAVYLPIHKYAKKLYGFLPLSKHMVFWFSFNYKYLRTICFDLLHAPVANYFGSDDIDKLCTDSSLRLTKKYLLRQTLWICRGVFNK